MTPFVLLFISHIIGDGLFKYRRLAELKRDGRFSRQILAVIIHARPNAVFPVCCSAWPDFPDCVRLHWFHFPFPDRFPALPNREQTFRGEDLNFANTLAYFPGTKNDPGKPDAKTLKI
jgi:hypothetical protein